MPDNQAKILSEIGQKADDAATAAHLAAATTSEAIQTIVLFQKEVKESLGRIEARQEKLETRMTKLEVRMDNIEARQEKFEQSLAGQQKELVTVERNLKAQIFYFHACVHGASDRPCVGLRQIFHAVMCGAASRPVAAVSVHGGARGVWVRGEAVV